MDNKLPKGKGLYVWSIVNMPDMWVDKFQDMGITWIAVKIADGVNSSNLRRMADGKGSAEFGGDEVFAGIHRTAPGRVPG